MLYSFRCIHTEVTRVKCKVTRVNLCSQLPNFHLFFTHRKSWIILTFFRRQLPHIEQEIMMLRSVISIVAEQIQWKSMSNKGIIIWMKFHTGRCRSYRSYKYIPLTYYQSLRNSYNVYTFMIRSNRNLFRVFPTRVYPALRYSNKVVNSAGLRTTSDQI